MSKRSNPIQESDTPLRRELQRIMREEPEAFAVFFQAQLAAFTMATHMLKPHEKRQISQLLRGYTDGTGVTPIMQRVYDATQTAIKAGQSKLIGPVNAGWN